MKDILIKSVDDMIMIMSNDLLAKERFDIGYGYSQDDYRKAVRLRRVLQSTKEESKLAKIQSELNTLKNKYL